MTSITLIVTGASIRSEVNGVLTSGMVGIPVTIQYDEAWNGLTKNLVCRCGKWGPARGDTRTILNVGNAASVAHEVMQAEHTLFLGIEGYDADGTLVMPTMWANCGFIHPGANADADPSGSPDLSLWAQLQAQIAQLQQGSVSQAQIEAAIEKYLEENPIDAPEVSCHCPLTVVTVTTDGSETPENVPVTAIVLDYTGITLKEGDQMQLAASVRPGNATNTAVLWETSDGSVATVSAGLVTAIAEGSATITARSAENSAITDTCGVTVSAAQSGEIEVALSRIEVTYSGGDVPVGTAVTALTGIAVTAYYANGVTKPVTDYTISGTINQGSNTITVSYGGKSDTFTVTGVAESAGDGKIQLASLAYVAGQLFKKDGTFLAVADGNHVELPYTEGMQITTGMNISWLTNYPPVVVYDGGKYFVPEYTQDGTFGIFDSAGKCVIATVGDYACTLSGYSENAKVYVNFYMVMTHEEAEELMVNYDKYWYIPGGEA